MKNFNPHITPRNPIVEHAKTVATTTKIYDTDKKVMIKECQSRSEAAKYLGTQPQYIHQIIKYKRKIFNEKLGINVTCR